MKETILAIDIGSSKIATIIANIQDKNVDILGFSISNSFGIEKGFIIDIDEAYLSIKNSITEAKKNLPIDINRTIITLCSKDSLNINSSGKINLPEKVITKREINQVLQTAQYNASIPDDYEMIQVIPKNFIVDNVSVINPLNLNAHSLEVQANVIVVKKHLLENFRNIFVKLNLNNLNFILNSYPKNQALTDVYQMKNGIAVLNILANNIAENIKFKYAYLLKDYKSLDNSSNVLKLQHLQSRFINFEEYILSSSVGALNYAINLDESFELDSNKKLLSSINSETKQIETIKVQNKNTNEDMKLSGLNKEEKLKINRFYKKVLEWF
ncbi:MULTISPECIES: cell division protein FtsA [Arcobacteraceae]|uniref:Cell division protein FtsA n=1 Tax=Arcobacter porcinus TaxID=1935204 RepID=A0ABX2YAV6_9BACT|nr:MULTISPECIES: cell division protein FtsA [Arcobacteraceae]AZL53704.1 hypothetical protein EI285_03575 [Aliarcobacter skirrowii]OCL90877.1 Cell division protein FtsA [Arcobacter porcinus]